jgi:hypothetical protein
VRPTRLDNKLTDVNQNKSTLAPETLLVTWPRTSLNKKLFTGATLSFLFKIRKKKKNDLQNRLEKKQSYTE